MHPKTHSDHPHLTGEHRWGDTGQLILLLVFLAIWISDSFFLHYSSFPAGHVSLFIRIPLALIVWSGGIFLARKGMKLVFGTRRKKPEVISSGVFGYIRHPIYTGALLFYLGAVILTLSLASAACWVLILVFYILIARYEERILIKEFGEAYRNYMERTGMLIPRLGQSA
jgi:protein-S-isoprenylcysteine O-methyltransferase Ste14